MLYRGRSVPGARGASREVEMRHYEHGHGMLHVFASMMQYKLSVPSHWLLHSSFSFVAVALATPIRISTILD